MAGLGGAKTSLSLGAPVGVTGGQAGQAQAHARAVFDIELAALKKVRAQLDEAFEQAVALLVAVLQQRGKIIVVGIGKSGNIGHKIAATLTSTGSTSVVLNSVDALHDDLLGVNAKREPIIGQSRQDAT